MSKLANIMCILLQKQLFCAGLDLGSGQLSLDFHFWLVKIPLVTSHVDYHDSLSTAKDIFISSDRVQKKINIWKFWGVKCVKKH